MTDTDNDYTWLFDFAKEVKEHPDAYIACSECDIFEKCQEENRDYCEKEGVKMEKRDFADMVIFFCQKVSEMNISQKHKMELLGMITAIEMKHDELMPKWIPVTEALPKPWQEVLTTYEYNGKRFVQTAEYAGQDDENGHPLFCAFSDEFAPDHYNFVYVAWMPLPEPWRGDR